MPYIDINNPRKNRTTDSKLSSDGKLYFGGVATNGSYKIQRDGNDLNVYRRESGIWEEKSQIGIS